MLSNEFNISLERVYSIIQNSEEEYHSKENNETNSHAEQSWESDAELVPTLTAAIKQFVPLPEGGFMSLQNFLLLMCIPATVGRANRMLEIVRTQNIDWRTAFAKTSEERQAQSGGGKRTRTYERVKKARQRIINASTSPIDLPRDSNVSTLVKSLPSPLVADCVVDVIGWLDHGKPPGALLHSLAYRLVAEACIGDGAALSHAANTILREAALRFVALESVQQIDQT